ncbi:MAG: sulfite exporter TauE/SafE family protein [Planctomycetota bacterium]
MIAAAAEASLTIPSTGFVNGSLYIVITLCVGIFVQSAAGFAAGLLIVPSLLFLGFTIPEASVALLVATVPQNAFGVYSLRDSIEPKKLVWPGMGRLTFFPVGVLTLDWVEQSFPSERIRQFVGGVVLAVTVATILFRVQPREKIASIWAWIAFPISGFLQGLVGMGGPAMVFWVTAHNWTTRQVRGFLFGMYLISVGPAIAVLLFYFGPRLFQSATVALASIPMLLVVTYLGLKAGNWLGRERLRRVTLGLLLLMGIVGLASPWIRMLTPE